MASLRRPWRTETVLKTSSPMPPYYSYEHALSWQICSTSYSISILGSRSTRFAASAERKLILKVSKSPENEFHHKNHVFQDFSIFAILWKVLMVKIEFLKLFLWWGMVPNWSDIDFTWKSIFSYKSCWFWQFCKRRGSVALILRNLALIQNERAHIEV